MISLTNLFHLKNHRPFDYSFLAILSLSLLGLGGCASPGKRTGIGAGIGATTGAIVGAATKKSAKGAGVGAAVGAVAGAAIGNYLDKQAQELKQVADTQRTEEGILVNLKNDLLFDVDSAVLKDEAIDKITQLGDILAKYKQDRIRIEGHTDSKGSDFHNEALSLRRAEAVKNILNSRGVQDNQVLVIGKGEKEPKNDNRTESERMKNRRVELHIDVPEDKS